MLGRLQHRVGFSRFNEGSRPVGKKENCEINFQFHVVIFLTADAISLDVRTLMIFTELPQIRITQRLKGWILSI